MVWFLVGALLPRISGTWDTLIDSIVIDSALINGTMIDCTVVDGTLTRHSMTPHGLACVDVLENW